MKKQKKNITEPKVEIQLDPAVLVLDRFASWCDSCKVVVNPLAKTCPQCKRKFEYMTTDCAMLWMPDAVRELRKDLKFIPRSELGRLKQ